MAADISTHHAEFACWPLSRMSPSFVRKFKNSKVFNFNRVNRTRWVESEARTLPSGTKLLDLGAGSCPYRNFFKHCEYLTQDSGSLAPGQLRDREGYGKIDYICDATAIPAPKESFDAVLCTEVLEHVPEPIRVLQEIARVIKPGGRLMLSAPLGSGLHQEPYHFYGGYTPYWYKKFLAEAGFADIKVSANGGFFLHFAQEGLRFVRMVAPKQISGSVMTRVLCFGIWVVSLPMLGVLLPYTCYFLDRLDREKKFTIGYHVSAIKSGAAG